MEYFVEQALTYTECLNKIRMKYGDRVTILYHKNIRIGGIFGLFAKDGVEVTGFTLSNVIKPGTFQNTTPSGSVSIGPAGNHGGLEPTGSRKFPLDFEEEKKKILDTTNSNKGENNALQMVLKEVQTIKEQLVANTSTLSNEDHSTISRISDILFLNDFSPTYSQTILDRIKKRIFPRYAQ